MPWLSELIGLRWSRKRSSPIMSCQVKPERQRQRGIISAESENTSPGIGLGELQVR